KRYLRTHPGRGQATFTSTGTPRGADTPGGRRCGGNTGQVKRSIRRGAGSPVWESC
ncbi:hypothetical protein KI387_016006, partial [Taxus chinensis]